MKSLRWLLSLTFAVGLSSVVFAESDAQRSFDALKTLAGSWEGRVTTVPAMPATDGKILHVSLRVTSRGHALMHEMTSEFPDDPITMLYLDGDRLFLTHYCDAGNRPRMAASTLPDGKTIAFELVDISGGTERGHMHQAKFTMIDENHHSEDWTFMVGNSHIQAHFDLHRVK